MEFPEKHEVTEYGRAETGIGFVQDKCVETLFSFLGMIQRFYLFIAWGPQICSTGICQSRCNSKKGYFCNFFGPNRDLYMRLIYLYRPICF
jgi:hypothetical protein